MTNLFDLNATQIKDILTQKNIKHEYIVNKNDEVSIGFRIKSVYNWITLIDETTSGFYNVQTYSQNTGKTEKGFETCQKVRRRFEKLINN